jgi:hypothetical protein
MAVLEGLEQRLRQAHHQLQEAMHQLIEKKNYPDAEHLLHIVDKALLDLIEDAGGLVVRNER